MRRRTLLLAAAAAGTGALSACGEAGLSSDTPIAASTASSSLAPRSVTAYVPPAGSAPDRAFAVGRRDVDFARGARALPTRFWYPSSGAAPAAGPDPVDGADVAPGRFPMILFSHGYTAQPEDYAGMLARWAQAGFVVAAPTYPHTSHGADDLDAGDIVNQPADASSVIDQVLARGGDPLGAAVDPARLGAAGHSAGGITTVGLFSAHRDDRLTAGVVLAGTDFLGAPFTGPPAAMLYVHGRKDDTIAWSAGHTVFAATPWSRAMLSITDGGHLTTGDSFEAVTRTTTEFLRWSLDGDEAAKGRIPQAAAVDGVATLDDQL
ncbi:alpha/beta hydrolase family protein [Mangrovihabitans endophyticus]|nr:chlorophyllase [Mangrovihabitans endophyticus]